jgi:hypothetical protein
MATPDRTASPVDFLGPGTLLGYCTNVHAGEDLGAIEANLRTHAAAVRERVCPKGELPVGLWLPSKAARELREGEGVRRFADLLGSLGLRAFTLNGFPFGDFHGPVVKHDVYRPDWLTPERAAYTLDLAEILAELLRLREGDRVGTISTLPVCWGAPSLSPMTMGEQIGKVFRDLDVGLARLDDRTGVRIDVAFEPEPGCFLSELRDVEDVLNWIFDGRWLGGTGRGERIGLCYDICHAAVMFEDQVEWIERLARLGVPIKKVQVSSALAVDLSGTAAARAERLSALAGFQEPRYLHQTTLRRASGRVTLADDLPDALADRGGLEEAVEARVHFHVPAFAESLGVLGTTQGEIAPAIDAVRKHHGTSHFEIETYAWGVLPSELRSADLGEGIAREFAWTLGAVRGLRA